MNCINDDPCLHASDLMLLSMDPTGGRSDRLLHLYPKVDEKETPLPRSWNPKDKYTYIGLSNSNLKVHYKGVCVCLSCL